MASTIAGSTIAGGPVRKLWAIVLTGVALGVTLASALTPFSAPAQEQAPRPPRVRTLLKTALDHYKRGEYDAAAAYFHQAQAAQSELTPTEQRDLKAFAHKNASALQAQRDGSDQLRLAEDALRHGKTQEAAKLARVLTANDYLSPPDKHALKSLNERLRKAGAAAAQANRTMTETAPAKTDAKSMLLAARAALQRGELEAAEAYASQAEKAGGGIFGTGIQPFWSDTPAKVRRDIQAARLAQTAPPIANAAEKKDSGGPLRAITNLLRPKEKEEKPGTAEGPPLVRWPESPLKPLAKDAGKPGNPSGQLVTNPRFPDGPGLHQTTFPSGEPQTGSLKTAQARQLVQEGYRALEAGDLETARRLAHQAKDLRPDLDWSEQNPDRLLADIQRRRPAPNVGAVTKAPPAPTGDARAMVREARTLLQQDKLEEADRLTSQASAVQNIRWGLFEDSPDKLRGDIQKARTKRDRDEASRLMVEARKLYSQGNFHEAKVKAYRAQQLHGPYWSVWELGDRPKKLLDEIERVEIKNTQTPLPPPIPMDVARPDKDQSSSKPTIPAAANPDQLVQNHPPKSKSLNPLANLIPRKDKQAAAQDKNADPGETPLGPLAQGPKAPPVDFSRQAPQPIVSGTATAALKIRAVSLIQEARDLQRKGQLLEARQKALEAEQIGVPFALDEDSPRSVLLSLASQCDSAVQGLLRRGTDYVQNHPTDPDRFQKAFHDLQTARQLAQTFGHDTTPIDQKAQWLQQAAASTGVTPLAKIPPPPLDPVAQAPGLPSDQQASRQRQLGLELLDKARLELRAGNTPTARRIAEQAFNPIYTVQQEASMVLRSIDAEEHNQKVLAAHRNAETGFDAFTRGDFRYAATILASIDPRMLHPDKARRIGEIMSMPQMQPGTLQAGAGQTGAPHAAKTQPGAFKPYPGQPSDPGLQLATNKTPADGPNFRPGKAQASDLPGEDLVKSVRAMEEIQFQQLRDRGIQTETAAMKLFKAGNKAGAIDTLNDYLEQLRTAQLDDERLTVLRRRAENRLNQYRTVMAAESLEGATAGTFAMKHDENKRQNAIHKNQEAVGELMKQYRVFQKEGKFKEALAAARKAKELDPDNVAVDAAIQITTIGMRQAEWDANRNRTEEQNYKALNNDIGIFTGNINEAMQFSPDYAKRVQMRESGKNGYSQGLRNPRERDIERRLSEPVSFSFKDQPLHDALTHLSALGGINIVPDRAALNDSNISLDQPLTLSVEKISLKSALNILLDQVKLTHVIKDEVLQVTTLDKSKGRHKTVTYPVADLVVPVENHPTSPVNDMQQALARHIASQSGVMSNSPTPYTGVNSLPQSMSVSSPGSGVGSNFATSPGAGQVSPASLAQTRAPGQTIEDLLINLIQNTVAQNSWNSVGGQGTIQYYPLGMALVINQTQEVQEDVLALLTSLRRLLDLEIAIEMRLVSVSENFFERMGLDFDINIRTDTGRREVDLLSGNFVPAPFVNRNLDRMNMVTGLTPAGTLTPDLNIPIRGSSFDFSVPPFGGFPGTLGADGGISLGLAFLSDIQVFMFMEAAQGDRRMNVMQAPKITVFNGQTATISVQDQQFFLTGVTLNQSNAQIFFTPQNQPFPLGVNLVVTPVVSADRRFVRLNLTPQMTNLTSALVPLIPVQIPVPQIFEGPGTGNTTTAQPVIFQMFFQQPTFTQIFVNTTVNVPDGGTVLLGGLKTMAEARNEFGPPILSKIPYLSRLFKNVGWGREGQSLMIMVTPRIIINEEEEQIYLGILPPIPRP